MKRQNMILIMVVILLAALPLYLHRDAEFGGSDDKIKEALAETQYKPWIAAIWEPPSAEVESFLFALQAAIGAGFLGYFFGYQQGRKRVLAEQRSEEDKCCT